MYNLLKNSVYIYTYLICFLTASLFLSPSLKFGTCIENIFMYEGCEADSSE